MEEPSDSSDSTLASSRLRKRVNSIRLKAKDKVQQLKNRSGHRGVDQKDIDTHEALSGLDDNPAFNPKKAQEPLKENLGTFRSKVNAAESKIEDVFHAVVHPQKSARDKAALETTDMLGNAPNNVPTQQDDVALVDAEDKLEEAKQLASSDAMLENPGGAQDAVDQALQTVMDLEEHRDKIQAGFAMTHVQRIRVVKDDRFPKPEWRDYLSDPNGKGKRSFDWKGYIGGVVLYNYQGIGAQYIEDTEEHPFEPDVLRSHLERLAISTSQWQVWAMDIRSVYRWENPLRTARWLIIFLVLWYTQHEIAYIVAWIIWSTVRNRFFPVSTDELRESMERTAESESTAKHLGELLDKHDTSEWLDELGKTVGQRAQLALGDVADWLDIIDNFRQWKSPKNTFAALSLLAVHLLMCFVSWDFTARYLYGIMGIMFFVCWPIQSHYSKFRQVASLPKILVFGIPTNAQWAFGYLRRQALLGQLNVLKKEQEREAEAEAAAAGTPAVQDLQTVNAGQPTDLIAVDPNTSSKVPASGPELSGDAAADPEFDTTAQPKDDKLVQHVRGKYLISRQATQLDGKAVDQISPLAAGNNASACGNAVQGGKAAQSPDQADPSGPPEFATQLGSTALCSFNAEANNRRGRLVITALGVHFQPAVAKSPIWALPFAKFNELRKLDSVEKTDSAVRTLTKHKAVSSGNRLLLQDTDGRDWVVKLSKDRDQAFNCLVGFSGLAWQKLQGGAARQEVE